MLSLVVRAGFLMAAVVLASPSWASAETLATPAPKAATAPPDPAPTPNPFTVNGSVRSYYFTRQNASNNPGTQFNFSPGAKYNSNGVNQATLNSAIDVHADYHFAGGGWYVGGSYFYANPISGPCTVASTHAKGKPCVSQSPPNTNPDDTLPGFALSTFPEAYLAYKAYGVSGKIGDQLLSSPWAGAYDATRLKPVAYQGVDVAYQLGDALTFEAADVLQFENRTSSTFDSNTLLTSFPAGGGGMGQNIYVPGGGGINTGGFFYGRVGYAPKSADYSLDGYLYAVSSLLNMWWFDGKYTMSENKLKPFIALQGGFESNAGASYIGKIRSSDIGVQLGANVTPNILVTAGFDSIPWQNDNVVLPAGVTCNNSTYQISAKGATLGYFLPGNGGSSGQSGVCLTNPNGTTNVYYGGWASPYTDNYATDPFFTTSISQGMADRRAPGTSWKLAATYLSNNKKWTFTASDAWYNYGNALVGQNTNEWTLDGQYHFSPVSKGRYKGLLLRYRYAQRAQSNSFCGASGSSCPAGAAIGCSFLGGLPLFKYNRAQIEYDF
ncbi:MAG: hypothetical protein ABI231_06740 [Candidatus Tumulicola sp.]